MSTRLFHPDEYELDSRSSSDSQASFDLDEADFESQALPRHKQLLNRIPFLSRLFVPTGYRHLKPVLSASTPPRYHRHSLLRRCSYYLRIFAGIIIALVISTSIFWPSYTRLPPRYSALRDAVSQSTVSGRGNLRNETIFIAASLYDSSGSLARGQWGKGVLDLIDLLGEHNVFLSIYENDSGPEGEKALRELEAQVRCKKSIIFEEHLDLDSLSKVTIPGGEKRTRRIEYLAEVRNRALRPLDDDPMTRYDRLLYLNDVVFDPVDILQLLFSTNADENGVAQYRAACAVDFINPFKFYDTYATRDLEGYSMGLPFFPWFSTAGHGESRKDVLAGKDAVRVRSCWGGMVAFDAKFFQQGQDEIHPISFPARFRASDAIFWEASECCLIHADIQVPQLHPDEITDTGIYMNPFVRVAYDGSTLSWLWTTRRFEKLYSFVHNFLDHLVGLPAFNSRRAEVPGQSTKEMVWVPNGNEDGGGSFQLTDQIAGNGGYCGRQGLQVLVQHRKEGQKGWETIPVPSR